MAECKHTMYHSGQYTTGRRLARLLSRTASKEGISKAVLDKYTDNICWYSATIQLCGECGADISEFNIHQVMTAEEFMADRGIVKPTYKLKRDNKKTDQVKYNKHMKEKQGSLL